MDNPHIKSVLVNFPDVDAASLPWPDGANTWDAKELELFIGSGGFLKPKKKKTPEAAKSASAVKAEEKPSGYAVQQEKTFETPDVAEDQEAAYEVPGFSKERRAITMPVRVHCEDTAPNGHVRIESLTAYAERIRSLALKQIMDVSLADLKEKNLAILATEYVVEIVGDGIRVLDSLRVDTTPEFPSAPLFPWETNMFSEDGKLYMKGRFALNLCQISNSGAYSGVDAAKYTEFTKDMHKWTDPSRSVFSATSLRFFSAYPKAGTPFTPTEHKEVAYAVRAADCDMYNVLFQARVPSMMESCHQRHDAIAFYVNIRMSVRPGDELTVHVFANEASALFVCLRGKEPVLTAFGQYGKAGAIYQEQIKCGSIRLPIILKFCARGPKPAACEDFDFSRIDFEE